VTGIVLKLGPRDAGMRLTRHEFAAAEFKGAFTYERVRGRLVVLPPRSASRRALSRPFRLELGGFWGCNRQYVEELLMPGWVATSEDDDRVPDICVYLRGSDTNQAIPQRVPELVLEVVSDDRADQERDYIDKRAEYHAIGVKEYVIVDRFKRAVLVLTWQPGDYAERVLKAADAYTTPLLPGLVVPLADVFPTDPPPKD
jgi:Uma2 family endonuclease